MVCPGMTSVLPASWGTQKLWITSADTSWNPDQFAHRDVQLIGRDDPQAGVIELPPPLMANDLDREIPRGGRGRGHRRHDAQGEAKEDEDQANGDSRPEELEGPVSVDLFGFGQIALAAPIAERDEEDQPLDPQEYDGPHREHDPKQPSFLACDVAVGSQKILGA